MHAVKFLFLLFLVALLVIVGSLNMGVVDVKLGFSTYSPPLFFLMLGAMGLGVLSTWTVMTVAQIRLKRSIRLLKRKVQELEAHPPVLPYAFPAQEEKEESA
mgnify:CR=1 FL=1